MADEPVVGENDEEQEFEFGEEDEEEEPEAADDAASLQGSLGVSLEGSLSTTASIALQIEQQQQKSKLKKSVSILALDEPKAPLHAELLQTLKNSSALAPLNISITNESYWYHQRKM
jgi:hypothetical protein